jgi:hypothetical protein
MSEKDKTTLPRRDALKLVMAGAAAAPLAGFAATEPAKIAARPATDPDLVRPSVPWSHVLSATELRTASVLCDLILPADANSPAASAVGVPDFIDEWVSAPYPDQQQHRGVIRGGLAWLNTEAVKRHQKPFYELDGEQQAGIVGDIHDASKAAPQFAQAAAFFDLFRHLTMGGYYSTEAGRRDLGYIGNTPLTHFPGATQEQLRHLGLEK